MVRPPTSFLSSGATAVQITTRALGPLPRLFHTSSPARSALFNLGGLATSREGQYLSKERGIPRTEYSSNIHLIRSSEVDPFPGAPGATKNVKQINKNPASAKHTPAAVHHVDALKKRHRVEALKDQCPENLPKADDVSNARIAAIRNAIHKVSDNSPHSPTEHVDAYSQQLVRYKIEGLEEEVRNLKLLAKKLDRNNVMGVMIALCAAIGAMLGSAGVFFYQFQLRSKDATTALATESAAAQAEETVLRETSPQESAIPLQRPEQVHPDRTRGIGSWMWSHRN